MQLGIELKFRQTSSLLSYGAFVFYIIELLGVCKEKLLSDSKFQTWFLIYIPAEIKLFLIRC